MSDGADWTSTGRLFQNRGPAVANERYYVVSAENLGLRLVARKLQARKLKQQNVLGLALAKLTDSGLSVIEAKFSSNCQPLRLSYI